jgi:hypothetical protein
MSEHSYEPDFVMNPGEKTSLLFMQMVLQLSSLATMLLGKAPHPESGEVRRDLDAAQLVIDQLEMIETKTKGNLTRDEDIFLRQTLMSLRLAYVEAVNQPQPETFNQTEKKPSTEPEPATPAEPESPASPAADPGGDGDSKKRFSKKY